MSQNFYNKRGGRYPKAKQEPAPAEEWQAQDLNVPTSDKWNDWGDQNWGDWTENNNGSANHQQVQQHVAQDHSMPNQQHQQHHQFQEQQLLQQQPHFQQQFEATQQYNGTGGYSAENNNSMNYSMNQSGYANEFSQYPQSSTPLQAYQEFDPSSQFQQQQQYIEQPHNQWSAPEQAVNQSYQQYNSGQDYSHGQQFYPQADNFQGNHSETPQIGEPQQFHQLAAQQPQQDPAFENGSAQNPQGDLCPVPLEGNNFPYAQDGSGEQQNDDGSISGSWDILDVQAENFVEEKLSDDANESPGQSGDFNRSPSGVEEMDKAPSVSEDLIKSSNDPKLEMASSIADVLQAQETVPEPSVMEQLRNIPDLPASQEALNSQSEPAQIQEEPSEMVNLEEPPKMVNVGAPVTTETPQQSELVELAMEHVQEPPQEIQQQPMKSRGLVLKKRTDSQPKRKSESNEEGEPQKTQISEHTQVQETLPQSVRTPEPVPQIAQRPAEQPSRETIGSVELPSDAVESVDTEISELSGSPEVSVIETAAKRASKSRPELPKPIELVEQMSGLNLGNKNRGDSRGERSARESPVKSVRSDVEAERSPRIEDTPAGRVSRTSSRNSKSLPYARDRSSSSSSSSDGSEIGRQNRELLERKMLERERELPSSVRMDDQKWRRSESGRESEKSRRHDVYYYSDGSEVRRQQRQRERHRSGRKSDGERARQEYYGDRRKQGRRRSDESQKRLSDESEYSEYPPNRSLRSKPRNRGDDYDLPAPRQKSRYEEPSRSSRDKRDKYSDYERHGDYQRRNNGIDSRKDRRDPRYKDHSYTHRPLSRGSTVSGAITNSEMMSESELSYIMATKKGHGHRSFDRHPAYADKNAGQRSFYSTEYAPSLSAAPVNLTQVRPMQGTSKNAVEGLPFANGQNLDVIKAAYESDPDYRYELDNYFADCAAQGFDVSHVQAIICSGVKAKSRDSTFLSSEIPSDEQAYVDSGPPIIEERKMFAIPHTLSRFTSLNTLVKVHPNMLSMNPRPPMVELHDLKILLEDDPQSKELAKFPGPLVRNETHKNQVIHFCNKRIDAVRKNKLSVQAIIDRESYVLLWELLVLLLRQNGHVTGTDISELLLKNAPFVDPASIQKLAEEDMSQMEDSDGHSSGNSQTTIDSTRLNKKPVKTRRHNLSNEQALSKFRELLLFGHRREAIEHAIRYDLWGHAFCLASKLDMKMYMFVQTKFYQSLLPNDPLQTVYQLYSGRQPTSVSYIGDENWGDWRPHLAMILSNPSLKPDIDAKSIVQMGEVLSSKGCLFAAHFCFLMAQVDFGDFSEKSSRLVLLGGNHLKPFAEFATNEAIMCTEIYEYAQSLSNPGYTLPKIAPYKYLHAKRLIDFGFIQEGFHYCERLAIDIVGNPGAYKKNLVVEVYNLASKLKFNDAHYCQGSGDYEDLGDPEWLTRLEQVYSALSSGEMFEELSSTPAQSFSGNFPDGQSSYVNPDSIKGQYEVAPGPAEQSLPNETQMAARPVEPVQMIENIKTEPDFDTSVTQPAPQYNYYQPEIVDEPVQTFQSEPTQQTIFNNVPQVPNFTPQEVAPVFAQPGVPSMEFNMQHRDSTDSMPYSSNSMSTFQNESRRNSSQLSQTAPPPQPARPSAEESPKEKQAEVPTKRSGPTSQAGRSWLGGIFRKIIPKGPNQMILPDDREQSIIWNEEKKCWEDKNADTVQSPTFAAAPPSDLTLGQAPPKMEPASPQMPVAFSTPPPAPMNPSVMQAPAEVQQPPAQTGSNRFQLIKGRSPYVNALNPGANQTASPVQLPQMTGQAMQPMFMPPMMTSQSEPFDLMNNRVVYDEQETSNNQAQQ